MKLTTLVLSLLAGLGAGWATGSSANPLALSLLPDCFQSNYDAELNLFTIRNAGGDPVNQQCLVSVGPRSQLRAGSYTIHVSNGGGGGAGGTWVGDSGRGGGGGGGGAGAREILTTVNLTEGTYKLTIGAGGPGGRACVHAPFYIGGGPGWPGSPSSMVRIAGGELVAGISGADAYRRPSRAQLDRMAGPMDGHGGSGPGQTAGGRGGSADLTINAIKPAEPGEGRRTAGGVLLGGAPGGIDGLLLAGGNSAALDAFASVGVDAPAARIADLETAGGGGGASTLAPGGGGGGERPGIRNRPPQRGALGSGGGGGEGSKFECDPGGAGGHGFIAIRPA